MLSVPKPSLAAKFVGHILSIIEPSMPHKPYKAILYFPGDFVGEPEPFPIYPFFEGEAPPKLFLAPVEDVELVLLYLVIYVEPELTVDYLLARLYFL